jgi:hypothetical protein
MTIRNITAILGTAALGAMSLNAVGGRVGLDLPIIHGVSAPLTAAQVAALHKMPKITLFADAPVQNQTTTSSGSGTNVIDKYAYKFVGADGYLWSSSFAKNLGYLWNSGYLWNQSTTTSQSAATNTESWNAQE